MKKSIVLFSFILLAFNTTISFSQTEIDTSEITSKVPELSDFHEIIYPMWHNAYPAKDINALKAFVPQIKTSMEAIKKASLPGILKDKKADWENQIMELNVAAENYYKAAEGKDDDALLAAAEKLHRNYEMMNRVIRPVLKEIDDYHQILYIIYHKLYPDRKYDEVVQFMDILIERADAIVKYPQEKLKKRLGDNVIKFDLASKELYKATISLKETLNGNDLTKKDEAVEHVHSLYQNLESVF
jgi:hypothetical protein